jgi:hypothetical protein
MTKNKNKNKKSPNLMDMPDPEKLKLIRQARQQLQQKAVEAKLWQSLIDTENLTINGNTVYRANEQLNGITLHK